MVNKTTNNLKATFQNVISSKNITNLNHNFNHRLDDGMVDEDGYFIISNINDKISDGPIPTYKLNHDGFRSQHFKPLDKSKTNILFAGCSWTFGEGVLEEHGWASRLSNLIANESGNEVDTYNVSVMGGSPHLVIKNVIGFISNYGAPDYIFINMPAQNRAMVFSKDTDQFFNASMIVEKLSHVETRKDFKRYVDNYVPQESLVNVSTWMSLLELYCGGSGTKLLWTAYDPSIINHAEDMHLSNFVLDEHEFDETMHHGRTFSNPEKYPNEENIPYWSMGYDENHPGVAWHYDISNRFMGVLKSRGMI